MEHSVTLVLARQVVRQQQLRRRAATVTQAGISANSPFLSEFLTGLLCA